MALVAACTPSDAQTRGGDRDSGASRTPRTPSMQQEQLALEVDRRRQSGGVVAHGGADAPYNYGPTVMRDGDTTRMWWCSQYGRARPPGDDLLHARSGGLDGPFRAPGGGIPEVVLSGAPGSFDGKHTCDPSVIRVNGMYYLYYTGAAGSHDHGNAIGLATSTDGRSWKRTGSPIVRAAHDTNRDNTYGAGQPAVVHVDGWFYLMFTDTTGDAAGWNGAGQFVLRAKEPTFSGNVEALGPDGFTGVDGTAAPRQRSVVDAFSADLTWIDAMDAFGIAHQTDRGTTVTFWNRDFSAQPYAPVVLPVPWKEGPGLVRSPQGHAPVSTESPCGRVPIDVVQATRTGRAGAPTGLRHFGADAYGFEGCRTVNGALAALDGFAVPSPERTMDVIADGRVLRVERRSVAEALSLRVLDDRLPVLDEADVAARLPAEARVVESPEGRGFLLGDTIWPVTGASAENAFAANGSEPERISTEQWRTHALGPTLGS
ncbi:MULTISPECIES: family 43 glycosylhydrolase [Prauserella salsuginis group]|uniref:Family 43 glycosylhydrolase n=1 Tax=Prauserella salsuginis TaxID=387889 RepID=A0ABW6GAB9_9PSEU|nr:MULTISPECIES: family 43 glycosylhydrolase [Prauserella salsuginis group]